MRNSTSEQPKTLVWYLLFCAFFHIHYRVRSENWTYFIWNNMEFYFVTAVNHNH